MNKKYLVAGIATMALGASVMLPLAVSADDTVNTDTTFMQRLANRLGINVDNVETAFTETREEIHSERVAERETNISNALSNGTLTQRQADILNAIDDAMFSLRGLRSEEDREAFRDLAPEERRTQMETELVNALNEVGLNTTSEELQSTKEAGRNANIMEGFKGRGMGRGMGL